MASNFKINIKTLFGFEEILAKELKELGGLNITQHQRMVSVDGDEGFIYKANLACRTAIKVLKPMYSFTAKNEKEYYDGIYRHDWSQYISATDSLAIDATTHSDFFTHSKYAALLAKDAIVDQFRNLTNQRPMVDTDQPTLRINIHIQQDICTVSLDSSGASLHLRGYRTETNIAPINEVLAAGLLLQSGWQGQCDFLDPMCGTGTILIEAAMIACQIPANIHRSYFAFQKWKDYDETLFETIKEGLLKRTKEFNYTITGYDIDFTAIKKANININNAYVEDYITLEKKDFFNSEKTTEGPLHILFNPPYNERISIDVDDFYASIGNTLKRHYPNAKAWFITSNYQALKSVGLKPSIKIQTFNGSLDSRLVCYDIYEGSKKNRPE